MEHTHIQYGGVRFKNNVPPEVINEFVQNLSSDQKDSLFDVVRLLSENGLITLYDGDNSTIDQNMQEFMEPKGGDRQ